MEYQLASKDKVNITYFNPTKGKTRWNRQRILSSPKIALDFEAEINNVIHDKFRKMKNHTNRLPKNLTGTFHDTTQEIAFLRKVDDSESYKEEIKKLKEKNMKLFNSLQEARCVSKRLLYILYEQGIINENRSIFSLFKEVKSFLHYRKIASMK